MFQIGEEARKYKLTSAEKEGWNMPPLKEKRVSAQCLTLSALPLYAMPVEI